MMIELVYSQFFLHNFLRNIKTHCICLPFKPQDILTVQMRFFSMDACLAVLGIAAAVLEDNEEAEEGAYGLDLQVNPNFVSPCLVL